MNPASGHVRTQPDTRGPQVAFCSDTRNIFSYSMLRALGVIVAETGKMNPDIVRTSNNGLAT